MALSQDIVEVHQNPAPELHPSTQAAPRSSTAQSQNILWWQ